MNRSRLLLLLALILVIALRLSLIPTVMAHPERSTAHDSPSYIEPAKYILADGYYSYPSAFRTPGYPYFLASICLLFGASPVAVSSVQVVLGFATIAVTFLIARRLISDSVAWLSVILLGLSLESIIATFFVLTETLFTFVFGASLLCLLLCIRGKRRVLWAIAAAILSGLAVLIRPVALFYPILGGLLFFSANEISRTARFRLFAIYVLCTFLTLIPWVIRNQRIVGISTISTVSQYNLLAYNAASLLADQKRIPIESAQVVLRQQQALELEASRLTDTEANRAVIQARLARQIILGDPVRYTFIHLREDIKNLLPGTGYLSDILGASGDQIDIWDLIRTEGLRAGLDQFFRQRAWVPVVVLPFLLLLGAVYAGSIIGASKLIHQREWFTLLFLGLPILYYLILPGAPSNSRFRVPVMPYLDILAAYGMVLFYGFIKRGRPTKQ